MAARQEMSGHHQPSNTKKRKRWGGLRQQWKLLGLFEIDQQHEFYALTCMIKEGLAAVTKNTDDNAQAVSIAIQKTTDLQGEDTSALFTLDQSDLVATSGANCHSHISGLRWLCKGPTTRIQDSLKTHKYLCGSALCLSFSSVVWDNDAGNLNDENVSELLLVHLPVNPNLDLSRLCVLG